MKNDKKIYIFAVLGSDKRQNSVAYELLKKRQTVRVVEDIGHPSASLGKTCLALNFGSPSEMKYSSSSVSVIEYKSIFSVIFLLS